MLLISLTLFSLKKTTSSYRKCPSDFCHMDSNVVPIWDEAKNHLSSAVQWLCNVCLGSSAVDRSDRQEHL